jgi:HK97 family phage portal protein
LGIFDIFTRKKSTTKEESRSIFGQTILGGTFGSSTSVSKEQALRVAAVWSCVRVLSETIASLPISLYEKDKNNNKIKLNNNPLNKLVGEQPSGIYNSFMFFERALVDLSFDGNFCAYIERNQGGLPIGIHPLQYKDVDVFVIATTSNVESLGYM